MRVLGLEDGERERERGRQVLVGSEDSAHAMRIKVGFRVNNLA